MTKLKTAALTAAFFLSLFFLFVLPALGQDRRVEGSASYSHLSTSEQSVGGVGGVGSVAIKPTSQNGYEAGVAVNLSPTLAVTFVHAGYFGHQEIVVSPFAVLPTSLIANLRTFYYQAGPKLTVFDGGSNKAYALLLMGDVNRNGEDAFAFSVGGGLDHKLNDTLSLNIFEAKYGFNRLSRSAGAQLQKEFRISTGLRFGK